MSHVRRRHHPREPKELDRGARPVSGAEPGDCCRRSQEAWRARLSLDDPRHQALPAGLRSGAENCDIRPGAVRSDDGAIPALGSQSVVVDVRIPAAITAPVNIDPQFAHLVGIKNAPKPKTSLSFPTLRGR